MGSRILLNPARWNSVRAEWASLCVAGIIAVCVFYVDTFTDIKSALATLYVITLLLSAEALTERGLLLLTASCLMLAVASFLLTHGLDADLPAILRLAVAVAAILITSVLIIRNHRARLDLLRFNAALQSSEARYRSIFEQSRVALWERDYSRVRAFLSSLKAEGVTDLRDYARLHPQFLPGCVEMIPTLAVNAAAMELLGHASAVSALSVRGFIDPNDSTFLELMVAVFNDEKAFEGRGSIIAKDGTTKLVLLTVGFPEDEHQFNRVIVGMMDITDREMAQKALLDAHAELALASRAAMAGALSASLAHELNQPLGALVVNAQTLLRWLNRQPPDLEAAARSAERIVRDSQRASEIIHNTRSILSRQDPSLETVSLPDLVTEAKSLLENELARNAIDFSLEVDPATVPVAAVRIELQQVVINLITNAIQAMSGLTDRTRLIIVSIMPVPDGMIALRVRDTGPGMSDAVMEKLFKPFQSSKETGLGMGLAICRAMVEARSGTLTAQNHPDGGAIFEMTVPIEANND